MENGTTCPVLARIAPGISAPARTKVVLKPTYFKIASRSKRNWIRNAWRAAISPCHPRYRRQFVYSCEDISGVLTRDRFSAWKMIYCTGGGGSLYVSGGDLMKRAY